MSPASQVKCVWEAGARLGEGPLWDPETKTLYWVDIKGRALNRYRPGDGARLSLALGEEIGCVAKRQKGGLIAAGRSGIGFLDTETGAMEMLVSPESSLPQNRFNDGKCDRRGRFWAGTMDDHVREPSGVLYRLDGDMKIDKMLDNFIVANGLGWSPDDKTMYFTDSERRVILAFDYDIGSGDIAGRRVFAHIAEGAGVPDGLTVDAEGFVWSAHWDGWRVTRYDPSGRIERVIDMPVPRPTSCAFGGEKLDRLFVTSASFGLSGEELDATPLSGGLFEIETGATGLVEPAFAG